MENVKYIGAPEGAYIQSEFRDPAYVVGLVMEGKDRVGYSYGAYEGFNSVGVDRNIDCRLEVEGIYENGIVYRTHKVVDSGSSHYDTYTACDVIVKEDGISVVVTGLDGRVSANSSLGERVPGRGFLVCNQEEVEKEKKGLGKKIEMKVEPVKSFFPSKRERTTKLLQERNLEILKSKVEVSTGVLEASMGKAR